MKIEITATFVALTILVVFMFCMIMITIYFIKAIFRFPNFRREIWKGITDGDKIPHQEDFKKTLALFWANVFGTLIVILFLIWVAFPDNDLKIPVIILCGAFLGCLGLKSIFTKNH